MSLIQYTVEKGGYKTFLEENGFEVKRSKQFASTIPLMYTECIIEKGSY